MGKIINNHLKSAIGKNIRRLRLLYKYSLDELAEILEISPGFLGLIERGERGLSLNRLVKLLEVFDVKFEELFDIELIESKIDIDFSKQLIAFTSGFTDNEKYILVNLLKAYSKSKNTETA